MRRKRGSGSPVDPVDKPETSTLRFIVIGAVILMVITFFALRWRTTTRPPSPPDASPQELLDEVATRLDQRNLAGIESLLDQVQRQAPDHATAWLYRGQLAREQGQLNAALEAWQRVPDDPAKLGGTARFLEATVLLETNQARLAEQKLLRSTELNPTYLQPLERLLALYVLQMRRPETLQQLDRIQQLRGLSLDELVLRSSAGEQITDTDEAIAMLTAFAQADPQDTLSRVSLVNYLLKAERHEEATTWLADLRRRPADDEIQSCLLDALRALDRLAEASVELRKHGPTAASPASFWRSAGEVADAEGDTRRAAECFEQVVRRDVTDRKSHYRAGLLLRRLGQTERAGKLLARAASLDQLRQQTTLAARADRRNTELLLPVLVEVGDLLKRLELYADAIGWYQLALSVNPREEPALIGLQFAAQALQQGRAPTQHVADAATAVGPPESGPPESAPPRPVPPGTLFAQDPPTPSGAERGAIVLRDVRQDAGLKFTYFNGQTKFKYLIEAMGGGLAVLDYDADGWPDLFFPQGCPLPVDLANQAYRDRFFRNADGQAMVDVTEASGLGHSGYGQGCVAGDLDNDGFTDLIVATFGRNVAYHNNGDGTFTDISAEVGWGTKKMSSSLALLDLNRDGNLDLYVANYVDALKVCHNARGEFSTCRPESFQGEQDELYLNRGDGTFEDATTSMGIVASDGKGLGVVTADFNGDGWPDIYVANDTTPNFLFQNQGQPNGSATHAGFTETGFSSGAAMSGEGRAEAGMGIACGDLNGDLHLDLFVTNYFNESNTAYFNHGDAFFEDVSRARGLAGPSLPLVGFGTQTVDLDLDGWLDLLVANGHIDDFGDKDQAWKMPTQVFRNLGGGRFTEVSDNAGPYFDGQYLGRGVARLDWNRDGRPDLIVVHQDTETALLQNETATAGHFVVLDLHGVQGNRDALGAKLLVSAGGRTQLVEICGGDGFYASNERRQIIGVGDATQIDRLQITWPGGRQDEWRDLPTDRQLMLVEGQPPRVSPLPGS